MAEKWSKSLTILIIFVFFFVLFSFTPKTKPDSSSLNGEPQEITSQINNKSIQIQPTNGYSFLVGGHLYGSPANNLSSYPSASLLANISHLNELDPDFMIMLGDIVRSCDERNVKNFVSSFGNKVTFPLLNAPGNHDLSDLECYSDWAGDTYSNFTLGNGLFILVNNAKDGEVGDKQLEFISSELEKVDGSNINTIFLLTHRPFWAVESNGNYSQVATFTNTQKSTEKDEDFASVILDKLRSLKNIKVFIFSSDINTSGSFPVFYSKEEGSNLTYIATGISDTNTDNVIQTRVSPNGEISFRIISLGNFLFEELDYYGLDYLQSKLEDN